jgi:hypothetical protein
MSPAADVTGSVIKLHTATSKEKLILKVQTMIVGLETGTEDGTLVKGGLSYE